MEPGSMKTKILIKGQDGTTAVEFAIILNLLILVFFGIIEWGLLVFNQQVITNASREGARAGIVIGLGRTPEQNEEKSECQTISETEAARYCADHLVTFDTSATALNIEAKPPSGINFGDNLTVHVNYDYGFLVLSNLGFPSIITLKATTIMKLE